MATAADSQAVTAALEALLAATPEPPPADADPDEVLALAARVLVERAPHCDALAPFSGAALDVPAEALAARDQLLDRDARWAASLSLARRRLGDQLHAAHRPRAPR